MPTLIPSSAGTITQVELLGHRGALAFTQDAGGLKIQLPTTPPGEHAFVLKITGLAITSSP